MTVKQITRLLAAGGTFAISQAAPLLRAALPPMPPIEHVPTGRTLDLPGRGQVYVVDVPGPTPYAPTVVLLHGLAATASLCWAPTLAPLSRVARVITFDQRWHGRGIHSPHFTLEDCADDAVAILDALDIPDAIIAGYSLGGAVAQTVWWRHPERVSGLVLCSTARNSQGNAGERIFFPVMNALARSMRPHAHSRLADRAATMPEPTRFDPSDVDAWGIAELRTMSPWAIPLAMNAFGHFNSAPWIGRVDVPTAVVVTETDRAIPGAQVHRAPGGHTSLMFDVERWLPVFLGAVADIADRSEPALLSVRTR